MAASKRSRGKKRPYLDIDLVTGCVCGLDGKLSKLEDSDLQELRLWAEAHAYALACGCVTCDGWKIALVSEP